MTVVGDLQQTRHPAGARHWEEALAWAGERLDLHLLTVTYRITRQIAATATQLLTAAGGSAPDLHPVRDGEATQRHTCTLDSLADTILASEPPHGGRVGVVVPDHRAGELMALLAGSDERFGIGDAAIDAPIAVLTARDTKGLEFDHVFVIEPDAIARQGTRGSDIYVACTRATQRLHLVTVT